MDLAPKNIQSESLLFLQTLTQIVYVFDILSNKALEGMQ